MSKEIKYRDDVRKSIKAGVVALANAVKVTLGYGAHRIFRNHSRGSQLDARYADEPMRSAVGAMVINNRSFAQNGGAGLSYRQDAAHNALNLIN